MQLSVGSTNKEAPRTVLVYIPIDIQGTEDMKVVDRGKYTGIYLYLRPKGSRWDEIVLTRTT